MCSAMTSRAPLPNTSPVHIFVPRGLRRPDAARYLGVSPSTFDRLREAGLAPPPRQILGVVIWDRHDLDALISDLPVIGETKINPWDE
jgi:predicted DNA-binding transcriptional regulator AlpA